MPTYDYECSACGHLFEMYQGITEEPIKTCPKCKKRKIRRLIGTGAGLLFKGTGFYTTDYRSDGYKKSQKAESPSSPASAATPSPEGKSAPAKAPPKASE